MTVAVKVLLGCIAGYFLAAVFIPRIRVRWGIGKGASITVSSAGVERAKWVRRKPQVGALSCLGIAVFAGGLIQPLSLPELPGGSVALLGLVLAGVGAVFDWVRDRKS